MQVRLVLLVGLLTFLVSLVTFIPGTAQAALTLNNLFGCETFGLDEAISSSGTPVCGTTVTPHSGDWSLELDNSTDQFDITIITGGSADGDNDFILGFALQLNGGLPSTSTRLLTLFDDAIDEVGAIFIESDGDLRLTNAVDSTVVTTTTQPIGVGSWQYIEISWQHSASGAFDLHVDGSSEISETGVDLTDGGDIAENEGVYRFTGNADSGEAFIIDDAYMYSGGTGTTNFLGNAEVFRYQVNTNSADSTGALCVGFPGANDLHQGVWQDLGETPRSSEATEPGYTDFECGASLTDDTQSGDNFRHGPHGDTEIDGDSNITGAKWLHILRRTNGSGTDLKQVYGDTNTSAAPNITLTTDFENYFIIGTNSLFVPLTDQHCAYGLGKNGGGRDIFAEEIWCFLLHVPDTGEARRIFPVQ